MREQTACFLWLSGMCLLIVGQVLPRYWASYGLALTLLGVLAGTALYQRNTWTKVLSPRDWMWLLAYPVWVAVAIIWSADQASGTREAMLSLPLVLLPVAAVARPHSIDERRLRKLLDAFVLVAVAGLGWALFRAFSVYVWFGNPSKFYYHGLAEGLGRSAIYLSYVVAVALLVLMGSAHHRRWLKWAMGLVLALGLVLLASKTVQLSTGLCALLLVVYQHRESTRVLKVGLALVATLVLAVAIMLPFTRQRWQEMGESSETVLATRDFHYQDLYLPELPLRLMLWRESVAAGEQHRTFGVGTGAQTLALRSRLDALHLHPRLASLNSHQQYLHTLLASGAVGLLALLAQLGGWLHRGWQRRNVTLIVVVGLFVLAGLSECWLVRHDGVYLFALVVPLLAAAATRQALE
jgi:hypothetical protein